MDKISQKYLSIISHYEECLRKHGDTHLGVDWPNKKDADTRYGVMLEVIKESPKGVSVLDFGCGTAGLLDYVHRTGITYFDYSGLDLSSKFIEVAKKKYPLNQFFIADILNLREMTLPEFDYSILNGVFTEKCKMSENEMMGYMIEILRKVVRFTRRGVAFNVMSKLVDWERTDLFYVSFDSMATLLRREFSRNFVFRNDYGLFEYTVYLYK